MANPHKGEVALDIDGETYTISLSLNAMCELEDMFERPLLAVLSEMEAMQHDPKQLRVTVLRQLTWGALQDHHPDIDLKQAGLLAGRAGLPRMLGAVMEAVRLAFPEPEGKAKANPRKAKG